MTDPKKIADGLRRYNAWRRNNDEDLTVEMPDPKELGIWIDSAIAVLDAHAENNDLAQRVEELEAERDALRPVCAEAYQMAGALGASVEAPQIDREKVRDAIAQALGCMIYCCTRSWEAWNVGTMRRDDFILASEDDCILDELTAAVISAIEAKPESGSAS